MNIAESYYRPNLLEQRRGVPDTSSPPFRKLTNQLIDDVSRVNPLTKKAIAIETGSSEIQPQSVRRQIETQVGEIVGLKTFGIEAGSDEERRVKQLARPFFAALTTDTHIKSIHADSYLELVALSLDFARNPALLEELTIQTGFGGSVDPEPNLRLPAYAIPALRMVENIQDVCEKYDVPEHLPQIRFAFAPNAAIAINGSQMPSEQIIKNTEDNVNYLQQYISRFHPRVAGKVRMEIDKPWDAHDETTQRIHHYFSDLLASTQDESVQQTLAQLQKLGSNHGDKEGERLAYDYTAIHSLIFGDALEHPHHNFFDDSDKTSLFTISIGGRPERLFNVARAFIRHTANIQGIIEKEPDSDDTSVQLESWRDTLQENRLRYGDVLTPEAIHEGDKPLVSVAAITTIGASPVYYATEYDPGLYSLAETPSSYLAEATHQINTTKTGQDKSLAKSRLKIVQHDLDVVIKDVGGEEVLMEFIADMQNGVRV